MFFFRSDDGGGSWTPCGSKQPGAVQTTMEELTSEGMAEKVYTSAAYYSAYYSSCFAHFWLRLGFPVVM
jgi:hypothetical protein